jgi:hypothetical protein
MSGLLEDASDRFRLCKPIVSDKVVSCCRVVGGVGSCLRTELGWNSIRPAWQKPLSIFDLRKATRHAWKLLSSHSVLVRLCTGVRVILLTSVVKYHFNGPKIAKSSGWSRWEICGGITRRITLCSMQNCTKFAEIWLSWPSQISTRGRPAALGAVASSKRFRSQYKLRILLA